MYPLCAKINAYFVECHKKSVKSFIWGRREGEWKMPVFPKSLQCKLTSFFQIKSATIYKKGHEKNISSTKPEETGFHQDSSS